MSRADVTVDSPRLDGDEVQTPLRLSLDTGHMLTLRQVLRMLPGKRITGVGEIDGKPVLAKLFIAKRGSARHWERERAGIQALIERGIPTPGMVAAGSLPEGGHYLLTEFVAGAQTLAELLAARNDAVLAAPTFTLLGRMHSLGLVHEDPHPGNFLLAEDTLYVIDGDGIQVSSPGRSALQNLALLFAQLPILEEPASRVLLAAYRAGNPDFACDEARLVAEISAARKRRLDDFLAKCTRNCTRFKVTRRFDRFVAVVRDEADFLAPILRDPDDWLTTGIPLKQGHTATLALVKKDGRKLVIKRYNIKGPGHALSRCWRPSRAWHSWVEGHRLRFLGIATPRPLALIENRIGALRGKAWLITEYCDGESLAKRLSPPVSIAPADDDLARLGQVFRQLFEAHISHGDMKATNLLCCSDRISLIDLDATRQHESVASFRKAWQRDRARFLRNWPEDSALRQSMASVFPEI
jgi:tRNA A-37 threonylcarbamoyl transferase component Bud32